MSKDVVASIRKDFLQYIHTVQILYSYNKYINFHFNAMVFGDIPILFGGEADGSSDGLHKHKLHQERNGDESERATLFHSLALQLPSSSLYYLVPLG